MRPLRELPRGLLNKMRELVRRTEETGVEHGTVICEALDGTLLPGNTCVGDMCSISVKGGCPPGTREVGVFHTHPGGHLLWSTGDDMGLPLRAHREVFCLGAAGQRYFLCAFEAEAEDGSLLHSLTQDYHNVLYDWDGRPVSGDELKMASFGIAESLAERIGEDRYVKPETYLNRALKEFRFCHRWSGLFGPEAGFSCASGFFYGFINALRKVWRKQVEAP